MRIIPKLVLRDNQVFSQESMGHLVGGYELPTVYVYGKALHTGNINTCPFCSQTTKGMYGSSYDGQNGYLLGTAIMCTCNKGKG